MLIYKVTPKSLWNEAEHSGSFDGAAVDLADGFIHFSTAGQLEETLRRHFSGQRDLVLIALDTEALGDALRWEPSRGGEHFPHLYRSFRVDEVVWTRSLPEDADARHGLIVKL